MKSVTIVIPTYNEERNIGNCLRSIFAQDYDKNKLQVIVADGGSKDKTQEIAKKMGAEVLVKPELPNEETRKPFAIKTKARGEIIGLIDADNVIPSNEDWLKRMISPFDDKEIFAADTLYYSFRKNDNLTTKYGALIGGDDPIISYLGFTDRYCYFKGKWTDMPHEEEDKGDYIKVTLQKDKIPASGSNGFFFRKSVFNKVKNYPFLHVLFMWDLVNLGYNKIAKVKQGIIHAQDGRISTFFKKKLRRMYRRYGGGDKRFGGGQVEWRYNYGVDKKQLIKTALYVSTIVLPIKDTIVGFYRKPTLAWLFHPIASLGVLGIYTYFYFKQGINF
ncbi:glycosyltransferase [Candidatus Pacearchaeota archaeon]|nr:glycosyltransferase [Candidatus Pacearchaeota archaeon]